MKNFLTIFIVALTVSFAQDEAKTNPEERAKRQTDRLTEQLNLTPEQAEQIHAINLKYMHTAGEKIAESKADGKKGKRGKGAKKHSKARDKEIKGVLNKDQKKSFKKMRIHQKEKKMEKRKMRKGKRQGKKGKRPQ